MPGHDEHCRQSLRRYGKSFSELHSWMDEPVRLLGPKHRIVRHDIMSTPGVAKLLFGEHADEACIDHILLDQNVRESSMNHSDCQVLPSIKRRRVRIAPVISTKNTSS